MMRKERSLAFILAGKEVRRTPCTARGGQNDRRGGRSFKSAVHRPAAPSQGCFPEIERVRMMGLLSPPDTAELSRELGVSGRRLNKIQQFLADQIIKRRVHPIA